MTIRYKQNRFLTMILVLALAVSCLAGCSASSGGNNAGTEVAKETEAETEKETKTEKETETVEPGQTRTIVDAMGTEVEVPVHPQAIAIVNAALPSMVYAIQGTAENIIAVVPSAYKGWEISIMKELAPEMADVNTKVISNDFEVNVEELAANKPDLLICRSSDAGQAEQIRAMGIPVAVVNAAKNIDTLKEQIVMLGEILNCQDRAARLITWYDEMEIYINSKSDKVGMLSEEERPRVLHFMYAEKLQLYADGVNPFITDWVGGRNIQLTGSSADTSTPTMEEILTYDPEIIFLSNFDDVTPDDLYQNRMEGQDWSSVSAVKNHRVYKVPCGLYRWAPPNTIEKPLYVLWQASMIQPDIFSDADVRTELKDFFKEFFDYELTEEQIDSVLHTDLNQ